MTPEVAKQYFGDKIDSDVFYVNPLRVAENYYFNKKASPLDEKVDYRDQAIDRVAKERLEFVSTFNSYHELFQRYVRILCPYCKENWHYESTMKVIQGGAGGNSCGTTYRCDNCKSQAHISIPEDGLSFTPKS